MLLLLAQWLAQDVRAFNVFNYITLRTVLAAMTALIISFIAGPASSAGWRPRRSVRRCATTGRRRTSSNRERRPWAAR
jgi:hypothetical protein